MNISSKTVCILTTVHPVFDPRIFHKQAKSLAKNGYEVKLITQHEKEETIEGVDIIPLPKPKSRFTRIFFLTWLALWKSLKEEADIYHFHDPELIPIGLILSFLGKEVIYDVHEDYVTSIENKSYLPRAIRPFIAKTFGVIEKKASHVFSRVIIAERYYEERFPGAKKILNYPRSHKYSKAESSINPTLTDKPKVLYTGSITESRGALIYANMVHLVDDLHVYLVGKCSLKLAEKIRSVAGEYASRIHLEGEGEYVPHKRIRAYYEAGQWLAGLAIFLPNPHYEKKEPTKFFEYMQVGIPVLASSFPTWEDLINSAESGLTVDPNDKNEICQALNWLEAHPKKVEQFGVNGMEAVEERYSWGAEEEKLLNIYRNLLH